MLHQQIEQLSEKNMNTFFQGQCHEIFKCIYKMVHLAIFYFFAMQHD